MTPCPLPTFLIIGAQKSATHWLRYNLGLHPDVYTADGEPTFFNNGKHFERYGVEWYRAQFPGWSGEPIVGESTPGYMFWRHDPVLIADRIQRVLPKARLIATLRDPVDRAHSALIHHIKMGTLPSDANLFELVRGTDPTTDRLGIISGGWYAASLEPYLERFGKQLLVVLHDDALKDPHDVYRSVVDHVGATSSFVPAELEVFRHSNEHRPLTRPQREELYEYFADDIRRLECMIHRDLSIWRP